MYGWSGTARRQRCRAYTCRCKSSRTVNAPRADRGTLFEGGGSEAADGWRDMLIWGDNLHALASLADRYAGQVDLIYIDPPFDLPDRTTRSASRIGDDNVAADQDLAKISSVIEEKAYRDTWGKNYESYAQMLYSRLILLRELLERPWLALPAHCAPNVSHMASRCCCDEAVWPRASFRAEIIWKRATAHGRQPRSRSPVHEVIACITRRARPSMSGARQRHASGPGVRSNPSTRDWTTATGAARTWPGDLTSRRDARRTVRPCHVRGGEPRPKRSRRRARGPAPGDELDS